MEAVQPTSVCGQYGGVRGARWVWSVERCRGGGCGQCGGVGEVGVVSVEV